ncbi:hypothetical protein, partial [Clostridium botulinum]|uniref:hypothetical protein n=1 Tax=Clostridium botulinum TaxID=1491 RepID=UPI000B0A954D
HINIYMISFHQKYNIFYRLYIHALLYLYIIFFIVEIYKEVSLMLKETLIILTEDVIEECLSECLSE